ncbi:ChuX/HutX family heme-like substrate-binding protein [uncultured Oxalicibacterium sp.]|uniref:hemin-degrading factor n=1 Tax=uncultured Oxalicibacterium sp. TaxID=1168540 RepID=UPI0025E695A8|nr:ChuX/HutX family heme-like substrate-binding protein [uncultured Oxalicibacterium sp.]
MQHVKWMSLLLGGLMLSGSVLADVSQDTLRAKREALRAEQPGMHGREMAQKLGVSEAQLVAADIGHGTTLLRGDMESFKALFARLPELGRIKAITRNEFGVIERTAVAVPAKRDEQGRTVPGTGFIGTDIDLRMNIDNWGSAFAVVLPRSGGRTSRSFQIFDKNGDAVHKVYVDDEKGVAAFEKLTADFKAQNQKPDWSVAMAKIKPAKPLSDMDIRDLRNAWHEMTDVHEFQRLVSDFGISRERAFELIGKESAYKISGKSVEALLKDASKRHQPIMVFLSNPGMTQIYSGVIENPVAKDGWFNVLDPDFDLHLRQSGIDHGWVVRRPARSGIITSVEFYDNKGNQIVNFFSLRERNKEETAVWRELVGNLEKI